MNRLVKAVVLSLSTALVAAPVFAASTEHQPTKQQQVNKAVSTPKSVATKKQPATKAPAVQKQKTTQKKVASKKTATQQQHKTGEKKPVKAA